MCMIMLISFILTTFFIFREMWLFSEGKRCSFFVIRAFFSKGLSKNEMLSILKNLKSIKKIIIHGCWDQDCMRYNLISPVASHEYDSGRLKLNQVSLNIKQVRMFDEVLRAVNLKQSPWLLIENYIRELECEK